MNSPSLPLADLDSCDREPIHVPGHIQPHGALLATYPGSDRISHVSANLEALTGLSIPSALGARLADVLGPDIFKTIEAALIGGRHTPSTVYTCTLDTPIHPERDLFLHRHLGRTFVEINPHLRAEGDSFGMGDAQHIMATFSRAETAADLCQSAADQLRQLTGYDRVMVYRFDPEGNGTVIAEAKAGGLEPFLNLRYPASDIPQQARRLYLLQRLRTIPDVRYEPVPLIAAPGAQGDLDMTYCSLRGVSPIHREYMSNMGVGATMVISLTWDVSLWGMIVCHHRAPRIQRPQMRGFCELIGQVLSLMLRRIGDAEALNERHRRRQIIARLQLGMEAANTVGAALSREGDALLELMNAQGAIINIGGRQASVGLTPGAEAAAHLIATLRAASRGEILALSDAGMPGGPAAKLADIASALSASEDSQIGRVVRFSAHGSDSFCDRLA